MTLNAMLREKDEVRVIPNDAIRAQLIHLREGQREIRVSQAALNARIDKTNDKIDAVNTKLSDEIKAVDTKLSDKIDKTNDKLDAFKKEILERFDRHSAEIKALAQSIAWIHITTKVVLAIFGVCVSIAAVVNVASMLGWI